MPSLRNIMYRKEPETAEEYVEIFNDFMEIIQAAMLEQGFELSPREQADLFQEYFIDQWEN
jgi:hypothetical protein